ncbi:MAG TPA: membrane protein insertase YidC [Thermoanaerobaculia bacterium]|nr:membrane protein insertase YidC [Thermoanaerobaculia bacterium]
MDTRRLVIAAALSFGFLVLWHYFFPAEAPAPSRPGPPGVTEPARPAGGAEQPRAAVQPGDEKVEPAVSAPAHEAVQAAAVESVVLETKDARIEFSNRGAEIRSYALKKQVDATGKPLELVRSRKSGPYPFAIVDPAGQPTLLGDALFQAVRSPDGKRVEFQYSDGRIWARKAFSVRPDGLFDADIEVQGLKKWAVAVGPGIRNLTAEELGSRFERREGLYLAGGEVEVLDPQKAKEAKEVTASGLGWVALDDTYFMSAVVPFEGVAKAVFQPVLLTPEPGGLGASPVPAELTGDQKKLKRDFWIYLYPSGDRMKLGSFWGSKEREQLASLPHGLGKALRLGMFWWLAQPLLSALHWIYDHVVPNYGWAIILLTTLIKIVLLPLTHSSTKSMRKMQQLNPKLQAMRERYRTKLRDKNGRPNLEMQRKMNEEMMAIYKAEGVQPTGGCLPMVLQMPVFFAFYSVLYSAVELRNAPWIFWIHDLSAKDSFYILPLVMGASQFLQVRMTPSVGDPMQRRLFQLMPVVMTFLFLGFPSGLVLYWLTNNVLTIAQQAVYNRWILPTTPAGSSLPAKAR